MPLTPRDHVARPLAKFARATMEYFLVIIFYVCTFLLKGLYLFQCPLAFIIALYIIAIVLSLAASIVVGLVVSIIPPHYWHIVNILPVLSPYRLLEVLLSHIPPSLWSFLNIFGLPNVFSYLCASSSPPFSELTDIQSSTFDTLRNTSVAGSGIALDISRLGAIALPALINMIGHTNITGKSALIDALGDVADQAPLTSRSLQRFGSAVKEGLAVVLGTNKVAMHRIEAGIGRKSLWFQRSATPDVQLFERAIVVFESAVDTLNMAAVACHHDLDRLEALLGTVETLVHDLHWTESWERDMLLSELWTFFGGNRQQLAGHNRNILWLNEALTYEKRAKENVIEARFTLDRMSNRISNLKCRFGRPAVQPGDFVALEIQYEVLATSIKQFTDIQTRGLEADEKHYQTVRLS